MLIFFKLKHVLSYPFCLGFAVLCLACCEDPSPSGPTEAQRNSDEDDPRIAAYLNHLGDSARDLSDYPLAISYYQRSMDSAAAKVDSFPYYDSMLDIACVYDRLSELDKAIQLGETVVQAYIRSEDSSRIGRGYTTLSAFYGRADQIEKQIITAKKGLEIIKKHGSLIECCAAYNQLAFTYSGKGRWAEALPMLDSALFFMQASKVMDQLSSIYLNLGNCHRNLQNWDKSKFYLQKSAELADSLGQTHVKSVAMLRLSQVAESQGDLASALSLFKQSAALKDTVLNREKLSHIQTLEVSYQSKEKDLQISLLSQEQKTERTRRYLVFTASLLALALLGFGLFQARQKLTHTRQVLKRNQEELKRFAEMLLSKNIQLLNYENALQEKVQKPSNLPTATESEETEADISSLELENLFNSQILTFEDWESFKHRFEQAYPGYLLRMRATIQDLSGAEERLFLLIKLGFNSQEIADTLGISINGVKKGRQRLRKRLDLQPDADLEAFIKAF